MSSTASLEVSVVRAGERVEVLFGELSELAGQRNAIDGRIVQIVAELDHDGLCGSTGGAVDRGVGGLEAGRLVGQRRHDRRRGAPVAGVSALRAGPRAAIDSPKARGCPHAVRGM